MRKQKEVESIMFSLVELTKDICWFSSNSSYKIGLWRFRFDMVGSTKVLLLLILLQQWNSLWESTNPTAQVLMSWRVTITSPAFDDASDIPGLTSAGVEEHQKSVCKDFNELNGIYKSKFQAWRMKNKGIHHEDVYKIVIKRRLHRNPEYHQSSIINH